MQLLATWGRLTLRSMLIGLGSSPPSNAVNIIWAVLVDGLSSNFIAGTIMVLRMTRWVFSWRMMRRATRGAFGSSSSSSSPDASNDPGIGIPFSSKLAHDFGTLTLSVPTPRSFHPASLESKAKSLARSCNKVASPDSPSST